MQLKVDHIMKLRREKVNWSSYKERKGNALALGAEEGRSNLRKATVRRKQPFDPWISEWGNPLMVIHQ